MTGTHHVKFTNLLTHQYAQSCGMQCSMLELLVDGYSEWSVSLLAVSP